jgi:hypothetical protein
MICNKSYLALVGYDDSYTNEALDLIPGNVSKTLVERNGRVIIGTYKESDPDNGINGAIDSEVPLAQIGQDGYIYYANGVDSIPIKRFPGGGYVNPGGVCSLVEQVNFFEWGEEALSWIDKQSLGNLAVFGVYGAESGKNGLYTYGRASKNQPFVLNLDYAMDVDEIGAICNADGTLLASYRDGTDFGVRAVDPSTKAIGIYEGLDLKAPTKTPMNITNWKQAEFLMKPLPSGCSVEFWYKINKSGSFIRASTTDGANNFSTVDGQKALFSIVANGEIFEPRLVLNPSGNTCPEIYRQRYFFN